MRRYCSASHIRIPVLPGITYVSAPDFYTYGLPSRRDAPFWVDHVLYDIPHTVEHAVRNGVRNGAGAFTLFEPITWLTCFRNVVVACYELNVYIVTADAPYFTRVLFWSPPSAGQ